MRVPLSWLAEVVPSTAGRSPADISARLTRAGFEVEGTEVIGALVTGVVTGKVLGFDAEPQKNGKTIRWCQVDVGSPDGPRGIVCGAGNFAVGDVVAAALPGAVLPGEFVIAARKTYGHVSDGMLCSAKELGLGEDHDGILILPPGTPLGVDATAVLGLRAEVVLDLAITPDRGYALSMRGVGREAAVAFEGSFTDPAAIEAPSAGGGHPVGIEDPSGCDRYVARVVTGFVHNPTPEPIPARLTLAGMRPVSLAVDITNHVMLLTGQPLHAFDLAKIQGPILVRRASAGETLRTLDGVDRTLDPEDLVIADDSGPIALAGVMGGESTEVTSATTDILIEAAHFDAIAVTRTARRHSLGSEASRRFERGVDPALPPAAAELAVRLLARHGGASPAVGGTDVNLRVGTRVITLPVAAVGAKAGRDYARAVVVGRLRDIGAGVADTGGPTLEVVPPTWRPDLTGVANLTEEVIRLEGYETLPSILPRAVPGRGLTPAQRARRSVGRALASAGLVEVVIPPFLGLPDLLALGLSESDERLVATRVANPLAEDAALLRTTLLPGLLKAAGRNIGRGSRDVAAFEVGRVFRPGPAPLPAAPVPGVAGPPSADELAALDAALPPQPLWVGGVFTGSRRLAAWDSPSQPAGWADAIEAAQLVARAIGVDLDAAADEHAPWHPGRCARLSFRDELIGHAGELHPRVCRDHDLPDGSAAFEMDLDRLLTLAGDDAVKAPSVSPYPPVSRDIALVLDASVPAASVESALRVGAGPLLESLRLFDLYAGEQLGANRRSLAYRLVFRAANRTLVDEEANAARDAAVALAADLTGAVLRT